MNNKKFILLGTLWLTIIGGYIAYKEYTLRVGQEILLKTLPVDPRDILRGDYVILNYNITNINLSTFPVKSANFKPGDSIYVGLEIKEKYAVATQISSTPPQVDLFIKGTIINALDNKWLRIEYGIENYFVPEGKGKEIEKHIGKNMAVKVAIDKSGNAVIKSLLIE